MESITVVKPKVELLHTMHTIENMWLIMEKCARLYYASEPKYGNTYKDAEKWCKNKLNIGHLSISRHGSVYLKFNKDNALCEHFGKHIMQEHKNNPYCLWSQDSEAIYLTTNYQFIYENYSDDIMQAYWNPIPPPETERYTVIVDTMISISRGLNRMSPNNIMEQSTRYINFFNKGGAVCQPWWFNLFVNENEFIEFDVIQNKLYITVNGATHPWDNTYCKIYPGKGYYDSTAEAFLIKSYNDFKFYNDNVERGMKPEDARDILPLMTATKVAYSFNIKELISVVNKRYFGTTEKPHPNAKVIGYELYKIIKDHPNVTLHNDDKKQYLTYNTNEVCFTSWD